MYRPNRELKAFAIALPSTPVWPTGVVTFKLHTPLPVISEESSLSPPLGGVKSIQLKFPEMPPPALKRELYHCPTFSPNGGAPVAGPFEHIASGIPQLTCDGASVATAVADTDWAPTPSTPINQGTMPSALAMRIAYFDAGSAPAARDR